MWTARVSLIKNPAGVEATVVRGEEQLGLVGATLLERYVVEECLTRGGMSLVYRGYDERLRRTVCVKVFRSEYLGHCTLHEHFVQEAFALSQLMHPNTVRIYDFGRLDDESSTPFHVSEFLDGGTLRDAVRGRGALSVEETAQVLERVGAALAEAHEHGLIHRDVKPSNIMYSLAGSNRIVKLVDFGIAKALGGAIPHQASETRHGDEEVTLLSLRWAAPEQVRREPVGPATDIYSLGLVAAYMLAGSELFPGCDALETVKVRMAGDGFLDDALAGVDPRWVALIKRACRIRQEERYACVEDLLVDVRNACDPTPEPIEPPSLVEQIEPPVVLRDLDQRGLRVGGKAIRLLTLDPSALLGGEGVPLRSGVRLRATMLQRAGNPVIHIKGLSCFVAKQGGRPSSAIESEDDVSIELLSSKQQTVDTVRVSMGRVEAGQRLFDVSGARFALPTELIRGAALLDLESEAELLLCVFPVPRDSVEA